VEFFDVFIHNISFVLKLFIVLVFSIFADVFIAIVVIVVFILIFQLLLLGLVVTSSILTGIQLVENILNLFSKLLITLSFEILKHVLHTHFACLGSKQLTSQNTVQRSIDMGSDHHVLMLYQLTQDLEHHALWLTLTKLLAFAFTCDSKTEIHQQGSRVFQTVLR
jgi:hypothetical protein